MTLTEKIANAELKQFCDHEFEGEGTSNCCGANIYPDSDICSDCKEHTEEEMWCVYCGELESDIEEIKAKNRRIQER